MPKTRRQEITCELYNELYKHQVDNAAVEIQRVAGVAEGVMREEQRALPVFFKAGGIYKRLLDKHPEFRQASPQAQQAEDAAIAELKSVIETKLASSHDRLNSGHVVGAQAAQEAVTDPSKRYRREYEGPDRMMTFDDIGRLHSALRLIFSDATIHPDATWRVQYFNGVSGYREHSYRHFLALIWKGATESDMVAPVNFTGMTSDELKGAAVEQIISALAQCRREHNYDRARPDWDQTQAPKDAQRCDMGLRGDLFGQMLMYNEHYMQTRAELNIELIEPLIRDFMVEEFTELSTVTKVKIISYLDNKAIALGDPEPEEEEALDTFVASMKARACEAILQKMMSAGPESPLSNIQKYIRNIQVKIQNPDPAIHEPAAAAMFKILELINDYVALEANSLFLLEPGNSANMDFLRRFAMHGIDEVYREKVRAELTRDTAMIEEILGTHRALDLEIMALQYRVENDAINTTTSRFSPDASYKSRVLNKIDEHLSKLATQAEQITRMVDRYAKAPGQQVASEFLFATEEGVASRLSTTQHEVTRQQCRILVDIEKMRENLNNMKTLLDDPLTLNAAHVRDHLKPLLNRYTGDKRTTPDFYAEYLLTLLQEKTPTGNYYIENPRAPELTTVSYLVSKLDIRQRSLLLFAFNTLTEPVPVVTDSDTEHNDRMQRFREIFATSLSDHGINLSDPAFTPTDKMTLAEVEYRASKITPREWKVIVAESGKQAELVLVSVMRELASREPPVLCGSPIDAAPYLPIVHDSEGRNPLQPEALSTWTAVAESIFKQDPTGEALINFVAQTLIRNLEIAEYSKEDHKIIGTVVKLYTGLDSFEDARQPLGFFTDEIERKVSPQSALSPELKTKLRCEALANHISVMLTTLSPPAVKSSFIAGTVRLMSRYEAQDKVGTDKYVLRLSNSDPSKLLVTTANLQTMEWVNRGLTSPSSFSITVGEKPYQIGRYPDTELMKSARPYIGKKPPLSGIGLEKTTNAGYQASQQGHYQTLEKMYSTLATHDPAMGFMQGQQVPQHLRQATHSLTAELNPLARPLFAAAAAASTPVLDSLDAAQPSVSRVSFFKPPTGAADVLPPELVSELAQTAQEVLSSSAGLPALSTTDGIISAARDVIHPDFANRPLTVVSATLSHAVEAFSDVPDVVADTSQPSGPSESYKACCRHFIDLCLRILGIIEQQTPRPA